MGLGLLSSFRKVFQKGRFTASREAYDIWAGSYDGQPGNLMLDLDESVFGELLVSASIKDKLVVDVGCGTGRHWPKILGRQPASLLGFDTSPGMLDKLKQKFPGAEAFVSNDHQLTGVDLNSADLIISTLTIAHIENPEDYFSEWNRVLKPGGEIILTDYHPQALMKGAKRTFNYGGTTIAIKNYVHPVSGIREIAERLGLIELKLIEKKIDDSVRSYYEEQDALHLFRQFEGTPIIYGIYLKKPDGTA